MDVLQGMRRAIVLAAATLCVACLPRLTQAQVPAISVTKVVGGLSTPVQVTNAGDGSNRLFVVEQVGRLRVIRKGALVTVPFLDITGRVLFGGEQGLLGLTFPTGYSGKGYFFVNYTRRPDGATVIARFRLSADPDIADPDSETILLTIPQPFANHNGGQMAFGPDGFLYIGMGDGGGGGDPQNNAQNPGSLLGKILRIDTEAPACAPYCIPATNPFVGSSTFLPEIWASGLRNPWRFSFDRSTGDLFIADVGQNLFEEINVQPAFSAGGENYGWRVMEGTHCFNPANCSPAGLVLPVIEYSHSTGNCSVTGGFVYRGQSFPQMLGIYLYADYCSGRIWGLTRSAAVWVNNLLLDTTFKITSFGEDEAGDLYLTDFVLGDVYKIVAPLTSASQLAASFTGSGLWVYNQDSAAWTHVSSADPENILYSALTLYADFGAAGLWMKNGAAWSQLSVADPENMLASGSMLYADFGGTGLWMWHGAAWSQLSIANPQDMVLSGSTLSVDFGVSGLWVWNGSAWSQPSVTDPEKLLASGSTLYADFGGTGLWMWNGAAWSQLSVANAENMLVSGSTLYADFGATGLWLWNGAAWSQLSVTDPENMLASGSTLYADFGATGLWMWNGAAWSQLSVANPENMLVFGSTLYADFGAGGLWMWNGAVWSQLSVANPENMLPSGSTFFVDFGAGGLWMWNGTAWSQLSVADPQNMVVSGSVP